MTANSSPSALDALIGGGVITKVAIDGSVVAPLTNTTKQIILDFEGATSEYVPPGSGQAVGTIKVTQDGSGGGVPTNRKITLATSALIFSDADATDLNNHDLAHNITIETVPANEFDEGTMSAADKSKLDTQLPGTNANAQLAGSSTAAVNGGTSVSLQVGGVNVVRTDGTTVQEFCPIKAKLFQDFNGYRVFEYEWLANVPVAYNTDLVLGAIPGNNWGATGTLHSSVTLAHAFVELEIVHLQSSGPEERLVFHGSLNANRLSSSNWSINTNLTEVAAERDPAGLSGAGVTASMALSGTNNASITITLHPINSNAGDASLTFKLRILGGGRYA